MNKIILFLLLLIAVNLNAQDGAERVTIVANGHGSTIEEAKNNALINALKQAFEAFISSKQELLNDSLLINELIAVKNGNIESYDILSETVGDQNKHLVTLKALISLSKLTSNCEAMGMEIEFKGELFYRNIKLLQLKESNEIKIIKTICERLKPMASKAFDFEIKSSDPKLSDDRESWEVETKVGVAVNSNIDTLDLHLRDCIRNISISPEEQANYQKMNIDYFSVKLGNEEFMLRSAKSLSYIQDLGRYLYFSQLNFVISDKNGNYRSPYELKINRLEDEGNNIIHYESPVYMEWNSKWDYGFETLDGFGSYHEYRQYNTYKGVKHNIKLMYSDIKKKLDETQNQISKLKAIDKTEASNNRMEDSKYEIGELENNLKYYKQEFEFFSDSENVLLFNDYYTLPTRDEFYNNNGFLYQLEFNTKPITDLNNNITTFNTGEFSGNEKYFAYFTTKFSYTLEDIRKIKKFEVWKNPKNVDEFYTISK